MATYGVYGDFFRLFRREAIMKTSIFGESDQTLAKREGGGLSVPQILTRYNKILNQEIYLKLKNGHLK